MNTPEVQFEQSTACLVPMCPANSFSNASHSLLRINEPESITRMTACRSSSFTNGRESGIFFMLQCQSTDRCAPIPKQLPPRGPPETPPFHQPADVRAFQLNRQTRQARRAKVPPAEPRADAPRPRSL